MTASLNNYKMIQKYKGEIFILVLICYTSKLTCKFHPNLRNTTTERTKSNV